MKVKTDYVPDGAKWYLTAGKVYDVVEELGAAKVIIDDEAEKLFIRVEMSGHLKGRPWDIVEE